MNEFIIVFCTTPNKNEAEKIAENIVAEKLAACVNIIDGLISVFIWENTLNRENEALMIIKTKKALFNDLKNAIIRLHSYKVPEIISIPVSEGSDKYFEWMSGNLK